MRVRRYSQKSKPVELDITDLAFDGKSVAHLDGKVVFLKGGLPGEKVLAEITRKKARYNEGRVLEILKKSDKRIEAICSHDHECGGCTWQDLNYQDQLYFKKKQVVACLERIGGLEEIEIKDVIGSVELFQYRNKMEFSFNALEDGEFTLGMHRRGRFDEVFDLETCYLQIPKANEIVGWMRDYAKQNGLQAYDVINHTGYMRFLMIRVGKRTGQIMVNVVTNYGEFPNRRGFVMSLREAFPEVATIVHNQNGQKSNIAVGEIEDVLYGTGYIEERLFDYNFRIRANSFFQTNPIQTESLYHAAFDMLNPRPTDRLLDLYCGTGSIGILVSRHVREVLGVEMVSDAVAIARENAELNKVENISFFEGDVKNYLRQRDKSLPVYNVVVLDPPRVGLHPKALKRVLELDAEKILYISCNPATFARDAAELISAGYRIPSVQPVDMFPHTMHIELVGLFTR